MGLSRYRLVGEFGEPYPDWIRDLRDERGVYVIRMLATGADVYVGHSTSDLRKTITRHFQSWDRESRSAMTPHYEYERSASYERDDVEAAVWVAPDYVPNAEIYRLETALICEIDPPDNGQKNPRADRPWIDDPRPHDWEAGDDEQWCDGAPPYFPPEDEEDYEPDHDVPF